MSFPKSTQQSNPVKKTDFAKWLYEHYSTVIKDHLQGRGNLSRDDLEYLVEKTAALKDERLKSCIATLIGWGDDERAEIETFCAIALEVIKASPASRIHDAARVVEIRAAMAEAEKK